MPGYDIRFVSRCGGLVHEETFEGHDVSEAVRNFRSQYGNDYIITMTHSATGDKIRQLEFLQLP